MGFTFQAPARRIWTVKDLMSAVRSAVEREYTDVFVEGEISNYRPAESGHLYFTLKEDGAQMRVVMFRSQARLLRFKPADGMAVIARGRVTVYEARGELQLSAQYLEPRGAGALQIAFEQLKQKLAAEGLFDPARKQPIPALPRRIGVVTSPRGAAIRDIVNIVQRRHRGLSVLIYPAQVQGEAAAGEVSAGIQYFNRARNVDVIVVARGGGSMEDLAAFNDEATGARGGGVGVAADLGDRARNRLHDFGFRGRPACAHAFGGGGAGDRVAAPARAARGNLSAAADQGGAVPVADRAADAHAIGAARGVRAHARSDRAPPAAPG